MTVIREQALLLGASQSLVGIVTPPVEGAAAADQPAVVMLNSGIIHRVGANRMNVSLARALAAAGHLVVRFDLSGIGDSEPRSDGLPPLEAHLADIREVIDTLQATRGVQRVVLLGLCSGADHSVVYAAQDARVVGAVLLDPTIPRTRRYYLRLYGRRAMRPRIWWRMLCGRYRLWHALASRIAAASQRPDPSAGQVPDGRPSRAEVFAYMERAYDQSVRSGVQFLAVFTAGLERQHNYREQILDAFPRVPFGQQLELQYHAEADHTFAAQACRDRVIREIVQWMQQARFPMR